MISRLTDNIKLDIGEKFILLFGNVNDEYCDNDLVFGNIDFMLWRYFKRQGYKRIVFFQGSKLIYFFDKESLKLCLPEKDNKREEETNLAKGPLGNLLLLDSLSTESKKTDLLTSNSSDKSNYKYNSFSHKDINYLGALQILDTIMLENIPTVIIFTNSENISQENIGKEAFNLFCSQLKSWSKIPLRTLNKCIFIFQISEYKKLMEIINKNKLNFLFNYVWLEDIEKNTNIVKIKSPEKDEINNLIHHFRLIDNLKIDWENIDEIIEKIFDLKKDLKYWYNKFLNYNKEIFLTKENLYYLDSSFSDKKINDNELSLKQILTKNLEKVYCQEDSINQIVNIIEFWISIKNKSKPLNLFFTGASGIGKTFTSKLIGESLNKLGYSFLQLKMTEYHDKEAIEKLFDSKNKDNIPLLPELLSNSENKLVILFDEIEKAHSNIFYRLSQILEEGIINWNKTTYNFKNCIILFTSNVEMKSLTNMKVEWNKSNVNTEEIEVQNQIRDIISQSGISTETLRRINHFFVFNTLDYNSVIKIANEEINKISSNYDLEIEDISEKFYDNLALKSVGSIYGVASFRNYLNSKIGKIFIKFKNDFPNVNKLNINFESGELIAIPLKENN